MGFHPTEESIELEMQSGPILEKLLNKDGLLSDKLFRFGEQGDKGYLDETNYPINILPQPEIIMALQTLRKKYPNLEISYLVQPYHFHARYIEFHGPNFEQILKRELFKKKKVTTYFDVYDDETGKRIARFKLKTEYREQKFHINISINITPWTGLSLHAILNNDLVITHMDGKDIVNCYWKYLKDKRQPIKCFRVDGEMPYEELSNFCHKCFGLMAKNMSFKEVSEFHHNMEYLLGCSKKIYKRIKQKYR